jgi:hypothetical protein
LAVQGSVQVTVLIDADSRDLPNARIRRRIGIGCGLKPLKLPTLEDLQKFPSQLPSMPTTLPPLPSFSAHWQFPPPPPAAGENQRVQQASP